MNIESRLIHDEEPGRICDLLEQNELDTPRAEIYSLFLIYGSTVLAKYDQDSTDIGLMELKKYRSSADISEYGSIGDIVNISALGDSKNVVDQR